MMNASDLASRLRDEIECFVFDSMPSTNDYLSQLKPSPKAQVCVCAQQTHGKGQYGRVWLSQKNRSILLSLRYPFKHNISLNGLSLVAGLAVIDSLKHYNIHGLKLKWPNDVFFKTQKLAGILIENTVTHDNQSTIIGLGLNYQLDRDFKCPTQWVDLATLTTNLPDLIDLQAALIDNLLKYCQRFAQGGFQAFETQWHECDYLFNKTLELNDNDKKITGIAQGVNEQGALIVQTDTGIINVYSGTQIRVI